MGVEEHDHLSVSIDSELVDGKAETVVKSGVDAVKAKHVPPEGAPGDVTVKVNLVGTDVGMAELKETMVDGITAV